MHRTDVAIAVGGSLFAIVALYLTHTAGNANQAFSPILWQPEQPDSPAQ